MRRFASILSALGLSLLAAPALALPGFEAGARATYWFPDLSGSAVSSSPALQGDRFDVKDDLGVEDEKLLAGEAFVRGGRVHFRVGYTPVGFDGNKALTRQINFGGETFNVSENVITRLDMDMIDADLQVDLFRPDLVAVSFNLGVIVKVKYVDGEVELRSAASPATVEEFKAPVPMLGLAAGVGLLKNYVRADARVAGIGWSGNHLFEGDAFVSIVPFPFLRLQGGYRLIDLKIDEDDILAELKLKGPYAGLLLSF